MDVTIDVAQQDEAGGIVNGKIKGKQAAPVERKIRYTADVRVICEDLPKAEETLKEAIKAHKGFIASSETTGSPGAPQPARTRKERGANHCRERRRILHKSLPRAGANCQGLPRLGGHSFKCLITSTRPKGLSQNSSLLWRRRMVRRDRSRV